MPGKMGPADPSYAGPEEALEMALLEGLLAEASTLLRVLNAKHGSKVVVGARELPPLSPPLRRGNARRGLRMRCYT